jgi:hypothetical protein
MTRKKPEGLEALVNEPSVPFDDLTAVDFIACFCMINSVSGGDYEREAEMAYDRAYAMLKERKTRL